MGRGLTHKLYLFSFYSLIPLLYSCASIPPPEKPAQTQDNFAYVIDQLSWKINNEIKRNKLSGIGISVVSKDTFKWSKGFGYSNIKRKQKIDKSTYFRAGSLAKFINALLVGHLHEIGKLDIHAPVTQYLPTLNDSHTDFSQVTLAQLMSHQAGLPSDLIKGMWTDNPKRFDSTLAYLKTIHPPDNPENQHLYSNLGFNVVAAVVESAMQTPYESVVKMFLDHHQLHHLYLSADPQQPPTATAYFKRKLKKEFKLRDVPAAGLSINLNGAENFLDTLLNNDLLHTNTQNLLFSDYTSNNEINTRKRTGLGIFYFDGILHKSVPIFGHNGASVNHRSLMLFSREHQYGVMVFSNDRNASASLYRIASQAIKSLHEAQKGKPAPQQTVAWPTPTTTSITDPAQLIGFYATRLGLVEVYQDNQKLRAKLAGRTFELYQREEGGLYYLRYKLWGIFPINLGYMGIVGIAQQKIDDQIYLIAHNTIGNRNLMGREIFPQKLSEVWRKRIGRYRIVKKLDVVNITNGGIKLADNFLIAYGKTDRGDLLQVALLPIDNDSALITGVGRGFNERVYVHKTEDGEQLIYSNIVFEKNKH